MKYVVKNRSTLIRWTLIALTALALIGSLGAWIAACYTYTRGGFELGIALAICSGMGFAVGFILLWAIPTDNDEAVRRA